MSLDMMERMDLVEKNKAIRCYPKVGPTFGEGYDLGIGDKCNQKFGKKLITYARFPWSYNRKKNSYKRDDREVME